MRSRNEMECDVMKITLKHLLNRSNQIIYNLALQPS